MEKQIVFKTSAIGGFDKKSVLDYIYALNQRAEEAQARMEDQLYALTQTKEQLEQELQTAHIDLQNTKTALEQKEIRAAQEVQELQKTLEEKTGEIWELSQKNAEHLQTNRDLESKRTEVEQASAQIGKLLIDAHAEADRIAATARESADLLVDEARQEADQILAEAQEKGTALEEDAAQERAKMMEDTKATMADTYAQFFAFQSEVATIQEVLLNALDDIRAKSDSMTDVMTTARNTICPPDADASENGDDNADNMDCDNATLADVLFGEEAGENPFFRDAAED